MLRLILVVLAFFIIWALFFSPFSKRQRVVITLAAVLFAMVGIWYEEGRERPKTGLVNSSAVQVCGLEAKHSYRTNYDFRFCLHNLDSDATLKRFTINVTAQDCQEPSGVVTKIQQDCGLIEQVSKPLSVTLAPDQQVWLTENMPFDKVSAERKVNWQLVLSDIKAMR